MLWDSLPSGLFLGGAPFNVACHLRAADLPAAMVSRVGADRLGEEVLRRAARYGVDVGLIQEDPALPTGFVRVQVDEEGNPAYEIVAPAAWDAIAPSEALLRRAAAARAIVFGSLAQRSAVTRGTIERLWETDALLVFDVNLRPPYDDREVVRRSLERAAVVKMTEDELRQIASWFGLPGAPDPSRGPLASLAPDAPRAGARAARTVHGARPTRPTKPATTEQTVAALVETFGCRTVCVTRGARGAALWREGRWSEHPGFQVEVRDTVGAGDAFLAVLLAGLLAGADDRALLRHANLIGAYVATQPGAVPADQPAPAAADDERATRRASRRTSRDARTRKEE